MVSRIRAKTVNDGHGNRESNCDEDKNREGRTATVAETRMWTSSSKRRTKKQG
jgi:hypothetical protein